MQNKKAGSVSGSYVFLRSISQGPIPWLAPLIIVLVTLFIYPTLEVIRYGFTDASLLSTTYKYTLKSYISIFRSDVTYTILRNTFIFVFFSVVFQTLLGLVIALAVDKGEQLAMHGSIGVRVVTLLSWAIPGVIIGIIWSFMYNETGTGIIITLLKNLHINNVTFLTNPSHALGFTIFANIWRGSAQSMILTYAGLKTIPKDIIEASNIDGANSWQRLLKIILPSIFSVISINIVLNTIMTFNTFDMIISLTGGGPGRATEVLALTSYSTIFRNYNLGKGSAYATVLLFINSIMAGIYFFSLRKQDTN